MFREQKNPTFESGKPDSDMKAFTTLALFFIASTAVAQNDTIVQYDFATGQTTFIPPPPYSGPLVSDHSGWNTGSQGLQQLPQTPPSSTGGPFIQRLPAGANYGFSPSLFPLSAVVQIKNMRNDTLFDGCTGIMIGPKTVLTMSACLSQVGTSPPVWYDSAMVYPGYDLGHANPLFDSASSQKYYIFKDWYDGNLTDFIGLIELSKPIGYSTGWVGIGYNTDTAYMNNAVFHSFTYPHAPDIFNPTVQYDGDTLYYRYGELANIPQPSSYYRLGVTSTYGEGGSVVLGSDNQSWIAYGAEVFASQSDHWKIDFRTYSLLLHLITQVIPNSLAEHNRSETVNIFPNPSQGEASLQLPFNQPQDYKLHIYNATGQLMESHAGSTSGTIRLPQVQRAPGLYMIVVQSEGKRYTSRFVVN